MKTAVAAKKVSRHGRMGNHFDYQQNNRLNMPALSVKEIGDKLSQNAEKVEISEDIEINPEKNRYKRQMCKKTKVGYKIQHHEQTIILLFYVLWK